MDEIKLWKDGIHDDMTTRRRFRLSSIKEERSGCRTEDI